MPSVNLRDFELEEAWQDSDPAVRRVRSAFPLNATTGSASTAVVYFELDPGHRLGRHTDSAEEVLLVLAGSGEAIVGEATATLSPLAMAVVPEMVPHEVVNTGDETLKVVGFFSSARVTSTFEEPWMPFGITVFEQGIETDEPARVAPAG